MAPGDGLGHPEPPRRRQKSCEDNRGHFGVNVNAAGATGVDVAPTINHCDTSGSFGSMDLSTIFGRSRKPGILQQLNTCP